MGYGIANSIFKSLPFVGSQEPTNGYVVLATRHNETEEGRISPIQVDAINWSGPKSLETRRRSEGSGSQTPESCGDLCEDSDFSPSKTILAICTEAYETIKIISNQLLLELQDEHDLEAPKSNITVQSSLDQNRSLIDNEGCEISLTPGRDGTSQSHILGHPGPDTATNEAANGFVKTRLVGAPQLSYPKGEFKRASRKILPSKSPYFTPPKSPPKKRRLNAPHTSDQYVQVEVRKSTEEDVMHEARHPNTVPKRVRRQA